METEILATRKDAADSYGESIYTKMIKAGHRTYFLDVKTTRANDHFISITELRKKTTANGEQVNERNKVFVYEEDLDKFIDGMNEVLDEIKKMGCLGDKRLK